MQDNGPIRHVKRKSASKLLPNDSRLFRFHHPISLIQGTGSIPPGWKGLHRRIRLNDKMAPFTTPYRATACIA